MEGFPTGLPVNPAPEERVPSLQEAERRIREEAMAKYLAENPDLAEQAADRQAKVAADEAVPRSTKESGPAVAFFNARVRLFEAEHPLGELHAIIELDAKDAYKHPIREPAKAALIPIVIQLQAIKAGTNITDEEHAKLKAAYRRLSQAVGMINGGKVDHTR